MDVFKRVRESGILPVVVIDSEKDAVPTAKALLNGGIDVMEITLRTPAAAEAIKAVTLNCPNMLVGAGTVITLEQCKSIVSMGAKFIVSPGFDAEVVSWCVENNVPIIPGCVTPTEIMSAMKCGLNVVKFFPSNVYGGLNAMKSLSAPLGDIKFIPTGGITAQNISEYISTTFVYAVGGSWICPKADISAGNFKKISDLCKEARRMLLGYEFAHLGINSSDSVTADKIAYTFKSAFDFNNKDNNESVFSTDHIEILKRPYLGELGHISIRTNCIDIAINDLEKKGFSVNMKTANYKADKLISIYLNEPIGGFAIHLLQK